MYIIEIMDQKSSEEKKQVAEDTERKQQAAPNRGIELILNTAEEEDSEVDGELEYEDEDNDIRELLAIIDQPAPDNPPVLRRGRAFILRSPQLVDGGRDRDRRRLASAPMLPFDDDDNGIGYRIGANRTNDHLANGIPCPPVGSVIEAKAIIAACVICHTNQIQTVNFPCMHACFCLNCVRPAIMHSGTCPQCRDKYMHISMLYMCYKDALAVDISSDKQKEQAETDANIAHKGKNKRKRHNKDRSI